MAECDYQELLNENPCLSALSEFDLEVIKTQLLCNIARGCDLQELLDDARCMSLNLSEYQVQLLKTQLYCNIFVGEIPNAIIFPASAVFTWVVPDPEIEGGNPFWDGGNEPPFSCDESTVGLETSYYFGLSGPGEDPNTSLTSEQIQCMIEIANIVVDDYLALNGGTEVSRLYWWQWVNGPLFGALNGITKAGSGNCDPNNPVGNAFTFNSEVGGVELSVKLCWIPPA